MIDDDALNIDLQTRYEKIKNQIDHLDHIKKLLF